MNRKITVKDEVINNGKSIILIICYVRSIFGWEFVTSARVLVFVFYSLPQQYFLFYEITHRWRSAVKYFCQRCYAYLLVHQLPNIIMIRVQF